MSSATAESLLANEWIFMDESSATAQSLFWLKFGP
jgi:hypothetical protein